MPKKRKKIGTIDSEFLFETRKVCKCGHTVHFLTSIPYIECSHCHSLIFSSKKAEYDYRLKRRFGINNTRKENS